MLRLASLVLCSAVLIGGTYVVRTSGTPVLPDTPYDYEGIELPSHLQENWVVKWDNTPDDNPITNAGATLGRVLFYDTRLSLNETVSCATCHRQENGFSDPRPLSEGFEGEFTERHSMALGIARYDSNRRFFWDGRARTLEELALVPIQDPIEMGMTLEGLTARLEATPFYSDLFADAFGTAEITPDRVSRALAQFIRSIVSTNSRYDAARLEPGTTLGRPLAGLTEQENQGLQVFFGRGCTSCHVGDLFVGTGFTNNGLDSTLTDPGAFIGRFKTVSLRNIGLTAPYMHDGRFATLEDVVNHYSSGVQHSPGLDMRLLGRDGGPIRMNFSDEEKAALVAFLHTLTDTTLATDPRWSNPFTAEADGDTSDGESPEAGR
ncbi:MAG: cytochrome c peroxidase [Bacteroidota bacterium]